MPHKDPERRREYDRKWREANRERSRAASRKWREANPERKRESSRKWHEANRERDREANRKWYEAQWDNQAERIRLRNRWRRNSLAAKARQVEAKQVNEEVTPFGNLVRKELDNIRKGIANGSIPY